MRQLKRRHHVRRARTGSDDAHAHLSGGQRVAFCRMGRRGDGAVKPPRGDGSPR